MRRDLPAGTVTFLFTDVEGSTRLLHELGAEGYAAKLAEHRRVVREACAARAGVEVDTQGDAFFVAFPTPEGALEAARAITEELASGPIALRIGLHTGTALLTEEGYVGEDVHFAARVAGSAHGGQVVLSQATRALLNDGYSLLELGEHRLKDISEPVAMFQLGDGQFPPLKTISNTNLPRPASSFVGRERELQEVLSRIEDGARLLTLTGPGGTGKTRLALEAAATLVPEYKAGVFWVGLASLRDPALVTETIAQTLGARDGLAEHIRERELLLVLDNLEQVVDAAPELSALLEACPTLTLLCTSRELLRVRGEVEHEVPPLASAEALTLFCERSGLEPSEEISQLCGRLDNLPLAVELAAARTKALTPKQILERLSSRLVLLKGGRDADPRQQTLSATIAWSYDLLSEEEQRLFRSLSVFAGGCTLKAAEAIAAADLDTLQSLVEKSLLRFTNGRYWMLETIREFAVLQALQMGELASMRAKHSSWVTSVVDPHGLGRLHGDEHISSIEQEYENVRAALAWLLEGGESAAGLALTSGPLSFFWYARGSAREADIWLQEFLSAAGPHPPELEARARTRAAFIAGELGDLSRALEHAETAVAMWAETGNADWHSRALNTAGVVLLAAERTDEAIQYFDEALDLVTANGLDEWWPILVSNKADARLQIGDTTGARVLLVAGLERSRQLGTRIGLEAVLPKLGLLDAIDGRPEAASELREALELERELGFTVGVSECLTGLAVVATRSGDVRTAALLALAGEVAERERGEPVSAPIIQRARDIALGAARKKLRADELAEVERRCEALELEEAIDLALSIDSAA